jgi:CRISPR-associated protein Cas1
MIKKTIYLGNPYYLGIKDQQLELQIPEASGIDRTLTKKIPLEDLGIVSSKDKCNT